MRVHGDPLSGRCLDVDRSRRRVRGTLGCAEFDSAAVAAAAEIADGGDPEVRTFTHDLGEIEVYSSRTIPARVRSSSRRPTSAERSGRTWIGWATA